ncbi:hypothetical protein [Actinopolymorpha alba]|uniref:hypothetical protein n=1 Tax=Actinopolymorpha alba TaxID=533267 RepID=UPI0012F6C815|nr:hypothetical protein [Actinopolymorpha alba]
MTTPAEAGSPSQTGASLLRDPRKWIAIAAGVVVIVAGIVLVWPKGQPEEVPDDLCAVIGEETLAKYVPDPKLQPDKIGPDLADCDADSPSGDFKLDISLSRGEGRDDDFAEACQELKSREDMKAEDLIKPSETTEFGDQLCGWIFAERSKSAVVRLMNYSSVHVIHGDDLVSIRYDGGTGSRSYQLRRTLDLTRSVLANLE